MKLVSKWWAFIFVACSSIVYVLQQSNMLGSNYMRSKRDGAMLFCLYCCLCSFNLFNSSSDILRCLLNSDDSTNEVLVLSPMDIQSALEKLVPSSAHIYCVLPLLGIEPLYLWPWLWPVRCCALRFPLRDDWLLQSIGTQVKTKFLWEHCVEHVSWKMKEATDCNPQTIVGFMW